MERVVIGRNVVILHVEPRRLVLQEVADMIYQTLPEDIVVDRREGGDDAVKQEDSAQRGQKSERRIRGCGGIGNGIDEKLKNIESDKRKEALQQLVEYSAAKRPGVTRPHHQQGFPKILHRI